MSRTKGAKDKKPRVMPKTGRVAGATAMQNPDLPEGWNTKTIRFIQDITPTEPLDRSDPQKMAAEMERRFFRYLDICAERDIKVSNMSAYLAMGIDKHTVTDWLRRPSTNPALATLVKKVQYICSVYRENLMVDGKINPVIGIFWQKNYDGFKDQQETILTPNNPLGELEDSGRLKEKYLANIVDQPLLAESTTENLREVAERPQKDEETIS